MVTTKPESEIAADLKARVEEAMGPVLAIMDEAAQHGLVVQWQGIGPTPPFNRMGIIGGVKLVKTY